MLGIALCGATIPPPSHIRPPKTDKGCRSQWDGTRPIQLARQARPCRRPPCLRCHRKYQVPAPEGSPLPDETSQESLPYAALLQGPLRTQPR